MPDSINNGSRSAQLFSPVTLGRYTLRNRLVMAPMTRNRAGPGDVPQALSATYYAQRASAGLIITEGSQVSAQGKGYPATPGIYSSGQVRGWRQVTHAVHAQGGRIFLQLWHVGRISHPALQPGGELPVAPSAIRPAGEVYTGERMEVFVTPRALDTKEIAGIIEQFRRSAVNALAADFDGVELHAANGYLLDQFLRDGTNRRTDKYGGSLENRARLLEEITQAVASVWCPHRVGVRFSPVNPFHDMCDSNPQQTFEFAARRLSRLGLAYLHVNNSGPVTFDYERLRRVFGGTFVINGDYDKARAEADIAAGRADLVSFGALFLANPDLPLRFERNAPLNKPDRSTFYGGGARGYTDYPALEPAPA
ncbi:MAG: alkene reductase [Burkholderiales bacterium]